MNEYFPSDEQIEVRAVAHAFGLLAAAADPKGAEDRLKQLVEATAQHSAARDAAAALGAEADIKAAATERSFADLVERTAAFQTWVDGTEKSYRDREEHIRVNEEIGAKREAALAAAEADLARRVAAHNNQLRQLKANLGEVAA